MCGYYALKNHSKHTGSGCIYRSYQQRIQAILPNLFIYIRNLWVSSRSHCVFAQAQRPEDTRTNFQTQERIELADQSLPRPHDQPSHQLEYKSVRDYLTRCLTRKLSAIIAISGHAFDHQ